MLYTLIRSVVGDQQNMREARCEIKMCSCMTAYVFVFSAYRYLADADD